MSNITKQIIFSNVILNLSIGIHANERAERQKLAISLTIDANEANEDDNIDNTLDYDQVYHFLKDLENTNHFDLQETVCRKILDFVLGLEGVERVEVSTGKTDIYPDTDYVGLRMSAGNN